MSTSETLLFEFGTEGGMATVSLLSNNTVIERGSSGGIEIDDPGRKWERVFATWDDWWAAFLNKHKEWWICFYPIFIHEEIKEKIRLAVDTFITTHDDHKYHKERWVTCLNGLY